MAKLPVPFRGIQGLTKIAAYTTKSGRQVIKTSFGGNKFAAVRYPKTGTIVRTLSKKR